MRTMFIPTILLLFCSLTQLTNAALSIAGCGSIYKCYAPATCITSTVGGDVSNQPLMEVFNYIPIFEGCPALFRFHTYTKYLAQVSIVSFHQKTTSITFIQKSGGVVTKFSCKDNNDGFFGDDPQEKDKDESPMEYAKNNLQCTFLVKQLRSGKPIFAAIPVAATHQFIIEHDSKTYSTSQHANLLNNIYTCDVSSFEFNNDVIPEKKFAKISYAPNRYYCKGPVFNLEYKKSIKVEEKDITCVSTTDHKWKIGQVEYTEFESIDIRCAADVKYFCKHDIKTKDKFDDDNEKPLDKINGNPDTPTPGELKCPNTYDYLFVDGKLIMNPTFECRNYGGIEYWTVLEEVKEKDAIKKKPHRLTPTGPVAYCAKTINCFLKYKIRDSAVERGTLHETKYTPICLQKDGVLQVDGKNVKGEVECNRQTGDFQYTIDTTVHIVTPQTKFKCYYAPVTDDEQVKSDKNVMVIAGGVGIGICLALVIGAVVAAVLMSKRHIKKMNARHEKEAMELFKTNEMGFKNFAFTDDERENVENAEAAKAEEEEEKKAAAKKKKAAKGEKVDDDEEEEPKSVECAQATATVWNDLIMDFRCFTEKKLIPNLAKIVPKVIVALYTNATPELRKACGMNEKNLKSEVKLVNYTKRREILDMIDPWTEFSDLLKARKKGGVIDKI